MDKIKAFFNNKVVKGVAWSVLALDVVTLVLGGATEVDINNGVTLTIGIAGAVSGLIFFIAGKLKK